MLFRDVSLELVYRGLYHFTHAFQRGEATEVVAYLAAHGKRRMTMPVRVPGKAGKAYRAGANLAGRGHRGRRTWDEFLATASAAD